MQIAVGNAFAETLFRQGHYSERSYQRRIFFNQYHNIYYLWHGDAAKAQKAGPEFDNAPSVISHRTILIGTKMCESIGVKLREKDFLYMVNSSQIFSFRVTPRVLICAPRKPQSDSAESLSTQSPVDHTKTPHSLPCRYIHFTHDHVK